MVVVSSVAAIVILALVGVLMIMFVRQQRRRNRHVRQSVSHLEAHPELSEKSSAEVSKAALMMSRTGETSA